MVPKIFHKVFLYLMVIFFSGCFWTNKISLNQNNLDLIEDGMTYEEVIEILGQPDFIREGTKEDLFTECWIYSYVKMDRNSAEKIGRYPLKTKKLHVWFDGTHTIRDFSMRKENGVFEVPLSVSG
tara:strand:+ start:106 stop:480 length:375 start_codon:yes stop_codon:yes gene_type:complete